ncbi:MAG: T9SS type A sorting domain-containing protein, partial [Rhodothermales bacterium]
QGTSNAQTTFVVHHHGNIDVSAGNFSISRGSQGLGTTTWYLYEGDFSMSNATTQSSTATPGGARFVFAKEGSQVLTLGDDVVFSALPIEVSSGTTLEMGSSKLGGSGIFILNEGGAISTALPGGVAEIFQDVVAEVTLEANSGFEFNGSAAQVTSDMMPAVVSDLIIDNAEGVALSQETTINGVLRLQAGVFDNTNPFTLGPEGSISFEGGSLLVDVASESESSVPQSFYVDQNFPNPFNPTTVFRYGLPMASEVTVRVYNVLGQQVRTFVEGHRNAGVHEIFFEAGGLSSGLYLYRVEAGNLVVTRQMVLLE